MIYLHAFLILMGIMIVGSVFAVVITFALTGVIRLTIGDSEWDNIWDKGINSFWVILFWTSVAFALCGIYIEILESL